MCLGTASLQAPVLRELLFSAGAGVGLLALVGAVERRVLLSTLPARVCCSACVAHAVRALIFGAGACYEARQVVRITHAIRAFACEVPVQ